MNNKNDSLKEKRINSTEREIYLDKLKDISGGYSFGGETYWIDKSICEKNCSKIDCKVAKICAAMEIVWVPGQYCSLRRREINPWHCVHCDGCAGECPYGAIKPHGK